MNAKRKRAMRKLRHAYLYIGSKEQVTFDLLKERYNAIRGRYDFRAVGHRNCNRCIVMRSAEQLRTLSNNRVTDASHKGENHGIWSVFRTAHRETK